jgi:hypothetical protein
MNQIKVNVSSKLPDEDYVLLKRALQSLESQPTPSSADSKLETKVSNSKSAMLRSKAKTAPNLPPPMNATHTLRGRSRFAAQTAGTNTYIVTGNSMAGALGSTVYVANTTGRAHIGTARLIRVTVWPSQDNSAVANVADVRWSALASYIVKDEDIISNLPLGITSTRSLSFTPPPNSLSGDWIQLGALSATQLFTVECSEGSIIDVEWEGTIANNSTGATISYSGVTAAIGTQGFSPLNGSGGGLLPLGVNQVL